MNPSASRRTLFRKEQRGNMENLPENSDAGAGGPTEPASSIWYDLTAARLRRGRFCGFGRVLARKFCFRVSHHNKPKSAKRVTTQRTANRSIGKEPVGYQTYEGNRL